MNRAFGLFAAIGARVSVVIWGLLTAVLLAVAVSAASGQLDPIAPLSPVQTSSVYVFLAGASTTMGALGALDYYVPKTRAAKTDHYATDADRPEDSA